MPKLYYTATSCGASSFIAASIAGVKLETEQVDLQSHKTKVGGADFYGINPKGNVPTLVTDDGTVLNENVASLLFIADQAPGTVAPAAGKKERYELLNALSYIASEVHPAVGIFFAPTESQDILGFLKDRYNKKLTYLEKTLVGDKKFLVDNKLSVADIYLYVVLSWVNYLGGKIDLNAYPKVKAYYDHIASLDGVKAAHARMASNPTTSV